MKRLYGDEPMLLHACLVLGLAALLHALTLGHAGGFLAVQGMTSLLPDGFWETVTIFGDERVLLALLLPFALRYPRLFWAVVIAALLAALLCRGIKWGLALPRPLAVLPAEQVIVIGHPSRSFAMPSGHTASVFALVGILFAWCRPRLLYWALALAALAGVSRIAVGAHWPLDVLVGATVGLASARLALAVVRRWDWGARHLPLRWQLAIAVLAIATLPFDGQGYPGSFPLRCLLCLWAFCGLWLASGKMAPFRLANLAVIKT